MIADALLNIITFIPSFSAHFFNTDVATPTNSQKSKEIYIKKA